MTACRAAQLPPGVVDVVGPVAELAAQLVAAKQIHLDFGEMLAGADGPPAEQHTLAQILALVRTRTGHDFASYKRSTLLRRIARRMQLTHAATLGAYLDGAAPGCCRGRGALP